MKQKMQTKKVTYSAMFLALTFVLPFFTGQIPQIGAMLCPMHFPVLLCGYLCGGVWGTVVGFLAPVLRSVILGMPMMFPNAICMAFELAAYALVAGMMHKRLPQKKWYIYISLISAMIMGRLIWGIAMFICLGLNSDKFGMSTFFAGAIANAIPGIILQLIIIPVLVVSMSKNIK